MYYWVQLVRYQKNHWKLAISCAVVMCEENRPLQSLSVRKAEFKIDIFSILICHIHASQVHVLVFENVQFGKLLMKVSDKLNLLTSSSNMSVYFHLSFCFTIWYSNQTFPGSIPELLKLLYFWKGFNFNFLLHSNVKFVPMKLKFKHRLSFNMGKSSR